MWRRQQLRPKRQRVQGCKLHCTPDTQPTKFHGQSCLSPGTVVVNKVDVDDVAHDGFQKVVIGLELLREEAW